MKKKIAVITIFAILVICLTACKKPTVKKENTVIDGISFKAEYEEYNISNYYNLDISKENPMKYVTEDNFNKVLSSSNIVYIGYAKCNICRNVVDILLNNDFDLNNIYYIDIDKIREKYDVVDEQLKETDEGTSEYAYLLEYLNAYTSPYIISKENKEYNTNKQIIYAPALLFIKDGKIVKYYSFNYNELENNFSNFSVEEKQQIISDIKLYISEIKK